MCIRDRTKAVFVSMATCSLLHHHRGTACRNHQHAVFLAKYLVIEIHADHGICARIRSTLLQFTQCNVARSLKLLFVGRRSATYQIADTGKHILEKVGIQASFAGK